ncbi:MAG: ERF family protein [Clostridia bacterium]
MEELIKIQKELKAPKGQKNTYSNYMYRSCEDILNAVKPLLSTNECLLTLSDNIVEVASRIYVKATAKLTNKNGQICETIAFAREEEVKKGMDAAQITGSASSYARKYALNGLFCIDDTKDADTKDADTKDADTNEQKLQEQKLQGEDKKVIQATQEELPHDIIVAISDVNKATTISALEETWKTYKSLDTSKALSKAISLRRQKLQI